ncbi:MAG: hypothetical protein QXN59_01215 [Candidatus Micrarchaeaceae archaeon]
MQHVYIEENRRKKLMSDSRVKKRIERLCRCTISLSQDGSIEIDGDAYGEFNAVNIIRAFGCGFTERQAELLAKDDYYSEYIDMRDLGSSKRIRDVKARVIGEDGKSKRYIEGVSGALVSISKEEIGIIGSIESIGEAKAAITTLLDGGTHKTAYRRMEAAHRKHKIDRLALG